MALQGRDLEDVKILHQLGQGAARPTHAPQPAVSAATHYEAMVMRSKKGCQILLLAVHTPCKKRTDACRTMFGDAPRTCRQVCICEALKRIREYEPEALVLKCFEPVKAPSHTCEAGGCGEKDEKRRQKDLKARRGAQNSWSVCIRNQARHYLLNHWKAANSKAIFCGGTNSMNLAASLPKPRLRTQRQKAVGWLQRN